MVNLRCTNPEPRISQMGHSRPGLAGRRSSHVRYAPKATFSHQNAIGRDGPKADIAAEGSAVGIATVVVA
jgi:hypothetical protein